MAHYRKMQIGNKTYRFNIGKSYVEIRFDDGKDLVPKNKIGFEATNGDIVITPRMIRDYIVDDQGPIERYFDKCGGWRCLDSNRKLRVDPFDIEIHDKTRHFLMCDNCYEGRADDI